MRKGRAQEFRAQGDEDWQGDTSAKELFYVWRKLKNQVLSGQSGDIESVSTTSVIDTLNEPEDEESEKRELDRNAAAQHIKVVPEISENVRSSLANNALNETEPSINQDNENSEIHGLENVDPNSFVKPIESPNTNQENNYQTEGQKNIPNPIENLDPVDNRHHSELCLIDPLRNNTLEKQQSNSTDEMPRNIDYNHEGVEPLNEQSKTEDEVSGNQPLENALDIQISIQSLEKTPTKTATTPKVPVKTPVVPISKAFAGALIWPTESPIKHGKKKSKGKLPDAISSQEWIRYWEAKDK